MMKAVEFNVIKELKHNPEVKFVVGRYIYEQEPYKFAPEMLIVSDEDISVDDSIDDIVKFINEHTEDHIRDIDCLFITYSTMVNGMQSISFTQTNTANSITASVTTSTSQLKNQGHITVSEWYDAFNAYSYKKIIVDMNK